MPLESNVDGIEDLNPAWPTGTDPKSEGDDHIRNVKAAVQGSWPDMLGGNDVGARVKALGFDAAGETIQNVADPENGTDGISRDYFLDRSIRVDNGARMSWGAIDGDGSTDNAGSEDWSVSKVGTGVYDVTFTYGAPSALGQIVVATAVDFLGSPYFVTAVLQNGLGVRFGTWNAAGSPADVAFNFCRYYQ